MKASGKVSVGGKYRTNVVNNPISSPSPSSLSQSSSSILVNNPNTNDSLPTNTVAYSSFAITYNNHLLEYCRTSMSALAGSTAGIMGLTSLYGFIFYIIMVLILWMMIMSKAGSDYSRYFTSPSAVLTNGFLSGLTTYVLFWTFLYGMVHVY